MKSEYRIGDFLRLSILLSKLVLVSLLLFIFSINASAQTKTLKGTPLWEIKDRATNKVSYIFGTMHVFGGSWLNSVTEVKARFLWSKYVLVEVTPEYDTLIMNSFKKPYTGPPIFPRKLFPGEFYATVNKYVKSIGWGDMDTLFYKNPQPILTLIALNWQLTTDYFSRLHLISLGEDNLDSYFAKQAAATGKIVTVLDNKIEVIKNLNKKQDPHELAQSIEELSVLVQNPKIPILKKYSDILDYKNLQYKYHFSEKAPEEDEKGGLDVTRRNKLWMAALNMALREGDCFIAVGIGHLDYKNGLINLLRAEGFEVNPIPIKKI